MFIRALIFFFGLLMLSTGISVITHAGLGTGTISSVALVLSKALPLSMGFFVFLTNVFFFVLQTAVDPSRFLVKLVKQIPICFVFGLFFDAAYALTSFVAPATYLASTVLRRSSTPATGSASESALTRSSTMSGTGRTSGADALKNDPSCVRSFATLPQ